MSVFDILRNEVDQIPDTSVFCLATCCLKTGYLSRVKRKKNMRPVETVLVTVAVILLLLIQLNQQQFVIFRMV